MGWETPQAQRRHIPAGLNPASDDKGENWQREGWVEEPVQALTLQHQRSLVLSGWQLREVWDPPEQCLSFGIHILLLSSSWKMKFSQELSKEIPSQ